MSEAKAKKLKELVEGYPELVIPVQKLITIRNNGSLGEFVEQKKLVADALRPVWIEAQNQELKRKSDLGLVGRMREGFWSSMMKLYRYFIPENK